MNTVQRNSIRNEYKTVQRLIFEQLESRCMLDINGFFSYDAAGGVLTIEGQRLINKIYLDSYEDNQGISRVQILDYGGNVDPNAPPGLADGRRLERLSGVDASTITKIIVKLDGVNNDSTDTGGGNDI